MLFRLGPNSLVTLRRGTLNALGGCALSVCADPVQFLSPRRKVQSGSHFYLCFSKIFASGTSSKTFDQVTSGMVPTHIALILTALFNKQKGCAECNQLLNFECPGTGVYMRWLHCPVL